MFENRSPVHFDTGVQSVCMRVYLVSLYVCVHALHMYILLPTLKRTEVKAYRSETTTPIAEIQLIMGACLYLV